MSNKPIANMFELPAKHGMKGSKFEAYATRLGGAIGAKALGAQYISVPAGKSAYPLHNHRNNEEMFVILEGNGLYRRGKDSWPIKAGDIIAAPAGGPETAHQINNTGSTDIKYLAISTRNDPDIFEYPDSNKFGFAAGVPEGGSMQAAELFYVGRKNTAIDYWDGEDIGEEE